MKLSKEEKAKYEVQKVITSDQVETHTSEGWTILESFEIERAELLLEEKMQEFPVHIHLGNQDSYGMENAIRNGMGNAVQRLTRHEKVKDIVFLVGKTKDSVLAEKQTKIGELEQEINEANQFAEGLAEEKKVQGEELEKERGIRRDQHDRAERNAKEREEHRERARKLELDIGKIRKAIGERQMNDILVEKGNE